MSSTEGEQRMGGEPPQPVLETDKSEFDLLVRRLIDKVEDDVLVQIALRLYWLGYNSGNRNGFMEGRDVFTQD